MQSKTSKGKSSKKTVSSNTKRPKINVQVKPGNMNIVEWQCALRKQTAEMENLIVKPLNEKHSVGEYRVRNSGNKQEYKVVYRGTDSKWNYCSCMDFKTSQLGTCKHLEAVKIWLENNDKKPAYAVPSYTSVYLSYRGERKVCIRIGSDNREKFKTLASNYFDKNDVLLPSAYDKFGDFLAEAKAIDDTFRCYGDATDFVLEHRERQNRTQLIENKYDDKTLDNLLKVKLFPYQKQGVRFACCAGRAIIADEMGLGKTIQAIASAELLRREGFVENVIIVCPTSLKYQWKREIERFAGAEVHVIEGHFLKRKEQYKLDVPYKIVSYNAVCNDIAISGHISTDMVIMDEVQRLKNWSTKIAKAARKIDSHYAILLSGTPLENRLEELYSIVQLADQYTLGPYYKFKDEHIMANESGKVVGYKNLNSISEQLSSLMIRRRKADVSLQLPERMDQMLIVPMTKEQREMHDDFKSAVARIVLKWQRLHFLNEHDRKRLMLLLSQMRMVCDSSYILDQKTRYDTKIDEVINILNNIFENGDEKVVIFSQWERMTRLVAQELEKRGVRFEYLHGGVPSKNRKALTENFTDLPESKVFLSTDAGSTGLNLQVASVIINLDLPWNPAVLEQRIARIYRIGQQRNINVINLVSAQSIEEQMIARLKFKSSMFEGALDGGEDTIFADDDKFKQIMDVVGGFVSEVPEDDEEEIVASEEMEKVSVEAESEESSIIPSDSEDINEPDLFSQPEPIEKPKQEKSDIAAHDTSGNPDELIRQGVSFFTGLANTLKSPEATARLVDSIVKEDPQTGQTSINIPISDKKTFLSLLGAIGKMIG